MLGTLFGVSGAFLVEFLDRTIKTPEEVERILGLPLLGSIPDVNDNSSAYSYGGNGTSRKKTRKGEKKPDLRIELLPHIQSRHVVSEAYRSLRTALLLSRADGLKSIVVSSARPGEGKSVTAANLALVLAQLERKVLLVDADLRKPRLHEIFRVSNRLGLVSYLTGLAPLEDVIVTTKAPNLHLIPSGPHSPNPAELLSSGRMSGLLAQLRDSEFDIAMFDTPPILPVADAIVLAAMSDGVILCLRAGIVERAHALGCRDRLRQGEVNIVGVLLNGIKAQHRYGGAYDGSYEEYIASANKDSAA